MNRKIKLFCILTALALGGISCADLGSFLFEDVDFTYEDINSSADGTKITKSPKWTNGGAAEGFRRYLYVNSLPSLLHTIMKLYI